MRLVKLTFFGLAKRSKNIWFSCGSILPTRCENFGEREEHRDLNAGRASLVLVSVVTSLSLHSSSLRARKASSHGRSEHLQSHHLQQRLVRFASDIFSKRFLPASISMQSEQLYALFQQLNGRSGTTSRLNVFVEKQRNRTIRPTPIQGKATEYAFREKKPLVVKKEPSS